jgi:DNA gyrase subunit A
MEKINLNEKAKRDFLNYASAVIKSRAISNVEDNLKPVHRRILYTMADLKLWSNKKTVKSNNVVGNAMLIHPHGDSSIYDAMVRLAQPWKMRYPLIEMQGNIGSILGDSAAANRYTEAKLSKFGEALLEDIEKNAVPFKDTYDNTKKEPIFLPSKFPNILCNGNSGIAVGLSASLVPHNLGDVVDAIIAYMNTPSIITKNLVSRIKGPDFPTGGTIIDAEKLYEIYEIGSGTITLRANYRIEEHGKQKHIIFYEVPYLVNIEEGIIEPLKKLVVEDNFDLIEDFSNETNKNGVLLRVILKKEANVYRVLDELWKNTRLQITQRINNTVLYRGNPVLANLKTLIQMYLEHRHTVVVNIANYDLQKVSKRIEIIEGLIKALEKIDEIIKVIREGNNRTVIKTKIMNMIGVNETQASAILDMKLGQLSKLDELELTNELKTLQEKKKELESLIYDFDTRQSLIKKELLDMKNLYKDERRTVLVYGGEVEGIEPQPIKILVFSNGNIFTTQQSIEDLNMNKKTNVFNQNPIIAYRETSTDRTLSVFNKEGNMTNHKVLTLGIDSFESMLSEPVAIFDLEKQTKKYLVFITRNGLVKKTSLSSYLDSRNNTKAIKLKDGDELLAVVSGNDDDFLYILGEKLVKFPISEIKETSKSTIGTKGINGEARCALVAAESDKIMSVNDQGQAKLTLGKDFIITAKGSAGQVIADNTTFISSDPGYLTFAYQNGKNQIVDFDKMSVKSKTSVGAKIFSDKLEFISN